MKKAREGVRVCMLVWDDKSSLNHGILQPWANHGGGSGMLMTHDEDTRRFFANTGVRCNFWWSLLLLLLLLLLYC